MENFPCIALISWKNYPSIVILQHETWKNSPWLCHVLLLLFNIKEFRKNWARLMRKSYNVNPLLCPNPDKPQK
jgi:hypothetical protein